MADSIQMKICKRCLREFDETDEVLLDVSPAESLVGLFITCKGREDTHDICRECREELGMMNLAGFDR